MRTKAMKQGICLLVVVLLLWTAVPGVAVEVEPLAFRTEPMVAAGWGHTVALRSDGTVWAWGDNHFGQLGAGSNFEYHLPIQVSSLTNIVSVAAGGTHTVALRSDGTVWAWGDNYFGQLGAGYSVQYHFPIQVSSLTNIVSISAGWRHTVALRSDGTVWAWGDNHFGQLGDGTTTDRNIPIQVQGLSDVESISAGWGHTVALCNDGTAWAWGDNWSGQLGDGTTTDRSTPVQVQNLTDVRAISAGAFHTVALRNDRRVWAWGDNNSGYLIGSAATRVTVPVQVPILMNIATVAAGNGYTVVVQRDGMPLAWGINFNGQLGCNSEVSRFMPGEVLGLTNVVSVAAGASHAMALLRDGTVWAWGSNWAGQLGNGLTADRDSPMKVRNQGWAGDFNLGTAPPPGRTHFNDVWLDDWFHDAVEFAYTHNIMQGTSSTAFAPRANFSRAQVVATLYRMEHGGTAREIPYAYNRPVFNDVEASVWYSPYIIWAYDNDIVAGIGGNRFGPSRNVTREQFAAMLHRFAEFIGHDIVAGVGSQWDRFTDLYQISTWDGAREALSWANYHGLITGRTATTITPTGTAQRAEAATILMRFMQTFEEQRIVE